MVSLTEQVILECCASKRFAHLLASRGPYPTIEDLINTSRTIWWQEVSFYILFPQSSFHRPLLLFLSKRIQKQTPVADWLEAFAAHPRIGDIESLRKKFDAFNTFSKGEQAAAAASATESTLQQLSEWNARYEAKFGHIFIICAAGLTAAVMLDAIIAR